MHYFRWLWRLINAVIMLNISSTANPIQRQATLTLSTTSMSSSIRMNSMPHPKLFFPIFVTDFSRWANKCHTTWDSSVNMSEAFIFCSQLLGLLYTRILRCVRDLTWRMIYHEWDPNSVSVFLIIFSPPDVYYCTDKTVAVRELSYGICWQPPKDLYEESFICSLASLEYFICCQAESSWV